MRSRGDPPPFRWADGYDASGFVLAAAVAGALLLAGASIWIVIVACAGVMNVTSLLLRLRARKPRATIATRLAHKLGPRS
jgi:hypothetical protein